MNSSTRRTALVTILVLLLAACGGSSDSSTEDSSGNDPGSSTTTTTTVASSGSDSESTTTTTEGFETAVVKVVTLPFITFAPFYIGIEEGYFEDYGIEVELVDFTVQEEILPALSSGQVDVSSGLVSAGMFNAIARGADIRITADKGFVDPEGCINWTVLGRADLIENGALETPDQLAGLTVNIVPATWLEYYLSVVLTAGGLTLDDIDKVNISSPAVPEALNQSQIDAAVNSEPWVTRLADSGHAPVLPLPQELTPNESGAVMLFGPSLLGENRDVGARFMAGYLEAVRQYSEGATARNLEIVGPITNLPEDLLNTMCWPAINPTGKVAVAGVEAFQQFAIDRGYLDTVVPAADFYDESFISEAQSLMGESS